MRVEAVKEDYARGSGGTGEAQEPMDMRKNRGWWQLSRGREVAWRNKLLLCLARRVERVFFTSPREILLT